MATASYAAYRRFSARPEALMLAALAAGAVILIAAAVIGGRQAQGSTSRLAAGGGTGPGEVLDYGDLVEGPAVGPEATSGTGGPRRAGGGPSAAPGGAPLAETGERVSEVGATREGVHADHFEFGLHGPLTFDGVPLNLAEDPVIGVKGYITHINKNGGINGLKVRMFLEDDRYTTRGGELAADALAKEVKPFIISGTLGIDQIAKVAKAAGAAGIPYFAGGGPEPEFVNVGMYQILSSYDQYADMVVEFICKYGPQYVGGSTAADVRLGTTTLNSENILPVEKRFVQKLTERSCVKTPVDDKARGTIQKPTEQASYGGQMINLRTAYANQGANLVVPLQDPVSTSRQVLEWRGSGYRPKWTIANFAHDGDTSLALFQGEWTGMRVMSGACYYHPQGGGDPYNRDKCAAMGEAHRQFVELGPVTYDQNAGGNVGGKASYTYQEGDANSDGWVRDGSGASFGYQVVYFWEGAMRAIGTDPTREKFGAALQGYNNYSNLVTSPLTFAGSPNKMHGATRFVLLEGQSNLKYRQVAEITPGLVDHF